jgi:hypothetical protein
MRLGVLSDGGGKMGVSDFSPGLVHSWLHAISRRLRVHARSCASRRAAPSIELLPIDGFPLLRCDAHHAGSVREYQDERCRFNMAPMTVPPCAIGKNSEEFRRLIPAGNPARLEPIISGAWPLRQSRDARQRSPWLFAPIGVKFGRRVLCTRSTPTMVADMHQRKTNVATKTLLGTKRRLLSGVHSARTRRRGRRMFRRPISVGYPTVPESRSSLPALKAAKSSRCPAIAVEEKATVSSHMQ